MTLSDDSIPLEILKVNAPGKTSEIKLTPAGNRTSFWASSGAGTLIPGSLEVRLPGFNFDFLIALDSGRHRKTRLFENFIY
jgi:hypothetical protein